MMKRYEIWWAKVKFEESDDVKTRPVLIWQDNVFIITAYKMTSKKRGDNKDEYCIRFWQEAGLNVPTNIRLSKLLKLEKKDFIKKIGILEERDRLALDIRISSR